MRTTVVHKEQKTFQFTMTDADVLARIDEVNDLTSQHARLDAQKKLVQKEQSQLSADSDHRMLCISRREEPREVECDIVFDYENRNVKTLFSGEERESRPMSTWEYSSRPSDVYPETVEEAPVQEDGPESSDGQTTLEEAVVAAEDRQEELAEKTENLVAPSANVNNAAAQDAKTETTLAGLNL